VHRAAWTAVLVTVARADTTAGADPARRNA